MIKQIRNNQALTLVTLAMIWSLGCGQQPENNNTKEKSLAKQTQPAQQKSQDLPAGNLVFTAPKGWVAEKPASSMRKAQYKLPGQKSDDGEVTVFHFPLMSGVVARNVDRWYGQFKQPDGSSTKSAAKLENLTVNNIPVTTVYCTGTFLKPIDESMINKEEKPGYAMIGAIAETQNGPWFF